MVSSIMLARLQTGRLSTSISQTGSGNSGESVAATSSAVKYLSSGLLNSAIRSGVGSKNLAVLLTQLQQTKSSSGSTTSVTPVTKLGSKEFMTALKKTLGIVEDDTHSSTTSKAMLNALKDGTLTVVDPFKGEKVIAWDPSSKGATASKTEQVTKGTWSAFLNDHFKRDSNGAFVKSKDGSYVDSKTGQNAYFTKVNGRDYYLTWPQGITIQDDEA